MVVYFSCICYNLYVDMRIAGIIFRIDAEKIKRRTSVSEENKVIDEVNTSGVVEQPVGVEEIPYRECQTGKIYGRRFLCLL